MPARMCRLGSPGGTAIRRRNVTPAENLNLARTVQTIRHLSQPAEGGQVKLSADAGSVTIAKGSLVNVTVPAIGGNTSDRTITLG